MFHTLPVLIQQMEQRLPPALESINAKLPESRRLDYATLMRNLHKIHQMHVAQVPRENADFQEALVKARRVFLNILEGANETYNQDHDLLFLTNVAGNVLLNLTMISPLNDISPISFEEVSRYTGKSFITTTGHVMSVEELVSWNVQREFRPGFDRPGLLVIINPSTNMPLNFFDHRRFWREVITNKQHPLARRLSTLSQEATQVQRQEQARQNVETLEERLNELRVDRRQVWISCIGPWLALLLAAGMIVFETAGSAELTARRTFNQFFPSACQVPKRGMLDACKKAVNIASAEARQAYTLAWALPLLVVAVAVFIFSLIQCYRQQRNDPHPGL